MRFVFLALLSLNFAFPSMLDHCETENGILDAMADAKLAPVAVSPAAEGSPEPLNKEIPVK